MTGTKGFSLRQSLADNGVTTEEATRMHLNFVYEAVKAAPRLSVARYRPNPSNPNVLHHG